MTPLDAFSWLSAHLGHDKAEVAVQRCLKHEDALEAIAVSLFHASDPRRQTFRQCIRAILKELKQ